LSVTIIGCGWLGFPLGKELVNQGRLVNGSVRDDAKLKSIDNAGITSFLLNLEQSTHISETITESTEVLIICTPPLYKNEPKKYQHILNELLDQFSNETLVIFTSSTGIYPKTANNFVESFELNFLQDSSALILAEETIRQSRKAYAIFRLGGLIGPNRHPIRFLQGRKDVKNPNGPINFVHQGDCIRAIVETIKNKAIRGTFNLVYPDHPTRKEYYSIAAKHYGLEVPTFSNEPSTQRIISSEKITHDFSFEFKFPIDNYPQLNFS
jgi:nucleoside-diphosphate-sugar epimerase